ncbi:class I SAM-dependent methyltransferase [Chitinophaga horti]|uniref:Class I SAM-dependent methyltransferase n=1 Tax=Chitinophaga horti TaxID=2920382 RepID=A0ABY6J7A1_9BACT|nr:class I SAM-dependent methyltransferase [Chitinophaga horti]UYQ95236.1 class I SAM-dependent methyltransferase [Chitinophaga horti]
MHPKLKAFLKKTALPVYLKLRGVYYKGNAVYCPVCEGSYTTFLPAGSDQRKVQCPRCRSNERDRMLWMYLDRHPEFVAPGKKLLHVAPEAMFYNRFKKIKGLDYTPADKFAQMFESTYPQDTIYLDIVDMKEIPDNTYDVIICSHVLEYVKEDLQAMKELHRVLKPGGVALLQVPLRAGMAVTHEDDSITTPEQRAIVFGDPGHIRFYGEDFKDRLESQGWKTGFVPITDLHPDEEIDRCVLIKSDDFHFCYKH